MAEADEFAVDAPVAPGRVLGGEAHDQSAELDRRLVVVRVARVGLGPVAGDASAVPAQQRVGCDDPAVAAWAGERGGDRAEQGPVVVVERGSVDLAAEDGELVAQHDDLEVLGAARTDSETGERSDEAVEDARHDRSASAAFRPGQRPRPNIRPPHGGDGYRSWINPTYLTLVLILRRLLTRLRFLACRLSAFVNWWSLAAFRA